MSSTPAQNEARFTVGRWSGTYHVPREYSDLQGLQTRLDGIVVDRLAMVCKSFLEQSLNGSDPSVWRVRELSLNFSLDAGFSDAHAVARDWGRSLASTIASIVENAEVGDSIVQFPNRAAYLAQFLTDLASSRAWGKWYYEEFFDLQALSCRQAICSIFLHGDTPPLDLLLQIASIGQLESVLRALNDKDARMIFDLCFDGTVSASRVYSLHKWAGIVLELWNTAPLRPGSPSENDFRDALRLLVRTLTRYPAGKGDPQLKAVISGLLELRLILLELLHKPSLMDSLFKHLANGEMPSAVEISVGAGAHNPAEALAFFTQLMQGDVAWASQAAAVVLDESNKDRFLTSKNIPEGESFLSAFGGIFLLGPSLIALGLDELASCACQASDSQDKTAAILRHLVAVKCFGRKRLADTCGDPALRLFSGMEQVFFHHALKDLNIQELNLATVHGVLLPFLLDHTESRKSVLFADIVSSSPDNSVMLLRDLAQDEWLETEPLMSDLSDAPTMLQFSLQRLFANWKPDRSPLFLSASLSSQIEASTLKHLSIPVKVLRLTDETAQETLAATLGLTPPQLAFRLESAQQHFPYFSLAGSWPGAELDHNLDNVLTLVARGALRHFSRKLVGFESSSPEHLYQNFLSGLSEVRRAGDHLEVRLAKSPLSLILRMAGLQNLRYAPLWLKGMEVWLLPPQE